MSDEPGVVFSNGSKFDIQLSAAKVAERRLAEIFCAAKFERVELKTEKYQWRRTGNIVIEYWSRGKPSGIAITTADYWVHELLDDEGATLCYLVLPVARLKKLCRDLWNVPGRRFENGGDDGAQCGILVSVAELLQLMR